MSDTNSSASLQAVSDGFARLIAAVAPSVVAVHSHRSRASGFVWRAGLIVTAEEALAEEGEIAVVLPGGKTAPATLAGRDPATDIALLRVKDAAAQPAKLDTSTAQAGALAFVVGSQNGAPLASFGIVSMAGPAWHSLRGGAIDARIEFDFSLRRQAEGGLALDAPGRALGMAVFGPRRRVLAIPAATIERVAAKLESHGRIPRGYLGLGLQTARLDEGEGGVGAMVMSVDPKGPGVAAGIKQGDLIVTFNGRALDSVHTLLRALGPESIGTSLSLSLRRAGKPIETKCTIGERPEP